MRSTVSPHGTPDVPFPSVPHMPSPPSAVRSSAPLAQYHGTTRRPRAARPGLDVPAVASLLGVALLTVGAAAAGFEPSDGVRDIESFLQCVNENIPDGQAASVADTVQCVPRGCTVTLTMSPHSAQAACFRSGLGVQPNCQLPRVLLTCPGPPRFMPSYLLCPVGSDEGAVRGINRVELGEEVDNARNMRMGDLAIPPGPYQMQGIDDVLSVIETNLAGAVVRSGSKVCNLCHTNPIAMPNAGDDALSDRIDPFGEFEQNDLHPCVISSDEPGRRVAPGNCPGDPVTEPHRQSLPEICDCIETALSDPSDVADNLNEDQVEARVALALCRALAEYQSTRGVCGAMRPDGPSSSESGPACTEPGSPCDPFSGELLQQSVGFVCQSTGTQAQCLSETVCGTYALRGGGKFLHDKAVSMLRIDVAGSGGIDSPVNVQDSLDIAGSLSAFDYRTRTRVEMAAFTFVEGTTLGSGMDFSASGEGKALVNGVPSDVRVVTSRSGDVVSFQIFRTGVDPEQLLFEGTGEAGRSGIGFEISVP